MKKYSLKLCFGVMEVLLPTEEKLMCLKIVDFMIDLLTIGKGKCGNTGLIKVGTNWRHHLKGVWLGSRCERLQQRVVCVICR